MNELFGDPLMCNDLKTLQKWVIELQELVLLYREQDSESKIIELLFVANANQGERLELAIERLEIEHELTKVFKQRCELLERARTNLYSPSGSQLN